VSGDWKVIQFCLNETSTQIGNLFKTAPFHEAGREVTALTPLAVDHDLAIFRDF
jgi:hypothetical protein